MQNMKFQLTFLVLLLLVLSACSNKTLRVDGQAKATDVVVKQWIEIEQGENQWNWVCYTELINHVINGFSCQNDTAMPLFSGGLVAGVFEYEYISKLILKVAPERMLSYIKLALYQPGTLAEKRTAQQFEIIRSEDSTQITDLKKQLSIKLTTL